MRTRASLVFAAVLLLSTAAAAKMPLEELARLGTELTPMGAVRAGSEDGLIPPWTGSITGLPPALEWAGPGTPYPDPFRDEQPLFVITSQNMAQYRERLTPGQIAMFETYPETFRMPVYPAHRDFAYAGSLNAKVRYNAEHAELYNDNEGIKGYIGHAAFPVPATGAEIVWLTRTTGAFATREGEYSDIAVFPNGTRSVRRSWFIQESPYADRNNPLTPDYE